jgi:MFS family permease
MNAVALNSALFNGGRVIGPSIAGVLVAAFGPAVCFAVNAASYLIGVGFFRGIKLPVRSVRPTTKSGVGGIREGLAYAQRTNRILIPTALIGVVSIFAMSFNVWLPLLANDEFEIGASGYGLLMASLGVGSLAGALNLAFFSDRPRLNVMFALAITLGLAEVMVGFASGIPVSLWLALPLLAVVGFAMSTTAATANTIVQTSSPDAMRGRIMALYMTVFNGVAPIGSLLTGALADRLGAPVAVAICGTTAATLAGLIWAYARTRDMSPRAVTLEFDAAGPRMSAESASTAPRLQRRGAGGGAGQVSAMPQLRKAPAESNED